MVARRGEFTLFSPRESHLPELNYNQITEIVLSHFDLNHPALKDLKVEEVVNEVIMSAKKHAFMRKKIIELPDPSFVGQTTHYLVTGSLAPPTPSLDPKADLKIRDLVIETIYRLSPEDAGAKGADGKPVPLPLRGFTRGDMGMQVIPAIDRELEELIMRRYHRRWGRAAWTARVQSLHVYGGAENPVRLDVMESPTNGEQIIIQLNERDVPYLRFRIRSEKHREDPKAILLDLDNIIDSDWSKRK